MKPTYLPTTTYNDLVERLLELPGSPDPESMAKILLGEVANIWPASLLRDPETTGVRE